jgi:hypothetical protein
MTSKTLKSAIWLTLAAGALTLAAGGVAFGKGGPPTDPPGGGGGGPGEETFPNNVSVPAIMIGTAAGGATGCGADGTFAGLLAPSGPPETGFPIDASAYYWVQGVHKWQADCTIVDRVADVGSPVSVRGEWGDNLTGDAKLKAGSPIRVELLLRGGVFSGAEGYTIVKLEPATLDRLSAYGTLATSDGSGGFYATAAEIDTVVYDPDAKYSVWSVDLQDYVVPEEAIAPEINATGKIVYGDNLRVPSAGMYVIKFKMPNVSFTGCDVPDTCSGTEASLSINVVGGGGSRPPRK